MRGPILVTFATRLSEDKTISETTGKTDLWDIMRTGLGRGGQQFPAAMMICDFKSQISRFKLIASPEPAIKIIFLNLCYKMQAGLFPKTSPRGR